ncbi:Protein kinase of the Mitotic Exit Network [Asimina triloba]
MADFRKDLCLDSLDRVELVMAIEQEFNVEIPDEKADQLTCCADVVKYIVSEGNQKLPDNSCSEANPKFCSQTGYDAGDDDVVQEYSKLFLIYSTVILLR